jgi:hypothetical protein
MGDVLGPVIVGVVVALAGLVGGAELQARGRWPWRPPPHNSPRPQPLRRPEEDLGSRKAQLEHVEQELRRREEALSRDEERLRRDWDEFRLHPEPERDQGLASQRARLIEACSGVHDLVNSDAVRTKLWRALADVGADDETLRRHRGRLVEVCVEVADMVKAEEVKGRLRAALDTVGVEAVEPDGQVFDPEVHEAMFTEPTRDPTLVDRIHSTVYPGYRDGDRTLRDPKVVVYVLEGTE